MTKELPDANHDSKLTPFDIKTDNIDELINKIKRRKGIEIEKSDDKFKINYSYWIANQLLTDTIAEIIKAGEGFQFIPLYQPKPGDIVREETVGRKYSSIEKIVKRYK